MGGAFFAGGGFDDKHLWKFIGEMLPSNQRQEILMSTQRWAGQPRSWPTSPSKPSPKSTGSEPTSKFPIWPRVVTCEVPSHR